MTTVRAARGPLMTAHRTAGACRLGETRHGRARLARPSPGPCAGGGRLGPELPEHHEDAERERHEVRSVAKRSTRVAGRERVGDQQEEADVNERTSPLHDVAAGPPELTRKEPEAGPGNDRAEQPELLADVVELPWIGPREHVADALWEVDDDRVAGREIHLLEL